MYIAASRPARLLHGSAISKMQDTIGRMYAPADSHARAFFVLESMIAAVPRDTSAVRPFMQPRRVVLSVLNPNDLMISEYWFVSPFAIS